MCRKTTSGKNPTERLAFGGCLQTLALCTVSNFADTLRRFAVYPRFALCRAALLNPTTKNTHRIWCVFFVPRLSQWQEPGQNIIACDNAISKILFMTRRCCPGNRGCCPKRGFYETGCGKTASCRRGTICRNFPCLQVARYQGRFPPAMPQSQCRQARR